MALPETYDPNAKNKIESFGKWLKGRLRGLPGTVSGRRPRRDDRRDPVAEAELTMHQERRIVLDHVWEWNTTRREDLGHRSPLEILMAHMAANGGPEIDDPDHVERTLARAETMTLTTDGGLSDHIRYRNGQGPDVIGRLLEDNQRDFPVRDQLHGTAKITVQIRVYDRNLDYIEVLNEARGEWVRLWSTEPDYTQGLSRWEHHEYRRLAKERGERLDVPGSQAAARRRTLAQLEANLPNMGFRQRAGLAVFKDCEQVRFLSGARGARGTPQLPRPEPGIAVGAEPTRPGGRGSGPKPTRPPERPRGTGGAAGASPLPRPKLERNHRRRRRMIMSDDPLGKQPQPLSGRRAPHYGDPAADARADDATAAFGTIWIPHGPQQAIVSRILKLRRDTLGKRGAPLPGLRLAQDTQAGKSSTLARVKLELAEERRTAGLEPNEFQVIHVDLEKKLSLKSVLQSLLQGLKDPDWATGTERILRERLAVFLKRFGNELLFIDEVQWLKREEGEHGDVTDALRKLLDGGVAPIVFAGDLTSKPVFERNSPLSGRLGEPLELPALIREDVATDVVQFRDFCIAFERELAKTEAVRAPIGFERSDDLLSAMLAVSGGHVGRVARILEHAVVHAAWRGALTVEPYDLSHVARTFAMPTWRVGFDPFSHMGA